jgi:hypothetical protein
MCVQVSEFLLAFAILLVIVLVYNWAVRSKSKDGFDSVFNRMKFAKPEGMRSNDVTQMNGRGIAPLSDVMQYA